MRAAVLREPNRPLEIEELEIAEPGPGEVMVKLAASGVCHSDLHVLNGDWSGVETPIVLGHEGAGTVVSIGDGVERTAVGDRVLMSWLPSCGRCRLCLAGKPQLCLAASDTVFANLMPDGTSRLRAGDERIFSFLTVGSLGEYAVVPENGAIPFDEDVGFDRAAVVGCAVATGVGDVVNTAGVKAGDAAVVFGCGGVGISVVQACAAQAANPLIAVDTSAEKLAVASTLGATHTIDASSRDPLAAVAEITAGAGVDFAFEAIGLGATIGQAIEMLGPAGTAVVVGMPPEGVRVSFDPTALAERERRVIGCNYGSCVPGIDFPRLLDLYRAGRLDLDALITRRLPLEQVNEAFDAMSEGLGLRSVIVYQEEATA